MKQNEKHNPCENKENNYYKIGVFSALNHVTIKTLRFYEEEGLLIPSYIDEATGYRYYSLAQMEELHKIQALKEIGITIDNIKRIKQGQSSKDIMSKRKAIILDQIAELTHQLSLIDRNLFDEAYLSSPVLVKKLPKYLVCKYNTTLDSYDSLFEVMPKMGQLMEESGIECDEVDYCYTEYFDNCYQEDHIHVACCQAIKSAVKSNELEFEELEETLAATIFHKGPYSKLSEAYRYILKYIEDNGYEVNGNIRERYIDGIWNKESENDWLTEIQIPVKKKK